MQRDFNPNFQDMAVLGATRAFRDWKVANGMAVEDGEGVEGGQEGETAAPPAEKPTDEELVADDYTDDELKKLEEEDPLSLIDSVNLRVGTPVTSGVASSAFCRTLFSP